LNIYYKEKKKEKVILKNNKSFALFRATKYFILEGNSL